MESTVERAAETPAKKKQGPFGNNRLIVILSIVAGIFIVAGAVFAIFTSIHMSSYASAKVVLYQGPKTLKPSKDATVRVDGKNVFVYNTVVNDNHVWVANGLPTLSSTPMAYFDAQGKVKVQVTVPGIAVKSCTISPVADKITPHISGHTVTFDVSKPGDYTLQFNNSVKKALHLFVNPLETNVPDKNAKNVVYVGPGEWNVNDIVLKDGQTLYIAGGAVIHGTIHGTFVKNIKICGRGIIDGGNEASYTQKGEVAKLPVDLEHSTNVSVEGIIMLNPNAWALNCDGDTNGTIKNIKIITARPNGDGITLQSCQNFNVSDSFVRSWDDSMVVKNYDQNSKNITFNNMMIWTDLAQSCEIGYETNKGRQESSTISDINFKNITIINNFHKPVISIHNSDDALVEDIHYQNITVENAQMGEGDAGSNNQLIDIDVLSSQWSSTIHRGNIRNVTIDNVNVLGGKASPSRIEGYDSTHTVENVTIHNLTILGKKITSLASGKFATNNYAKNIKIQ